jgi:hypothetical protein
VRKRKKRCKEEGKEGKLNNREKWERNLKGK